jgi:hypothetical protein
MKDNDLNDIEMFQIAKEIFEENSNRALRTISNGEVFEKFKDLMVWAFRKAILFHEEIIVLEIIHSSRYRSFDIVINHWILDHLI